MIPKTRVPHWLFGVALLAAADGLSAAAFDTSLVMQAQAQFFGGGERYAPPRRRSGGGFFDNLFSPFGGGTTPRYEDYPGAQQPVESSRAPAPKKPDKDALPPTTSVVVLGDGMADWLAYGLEDAFADAPEIGIVRKNKINSGLIHYDPRGDLDWWHVAKDLLAPEKPAYVIMMLGLSDRQAIRERDIAKDAEKKAKDAKDDKAKDAKDNKEEKPAEADTAQKQGDEGEAITATEPRSRRGVSGQVEFRSDRWAEIYTRRIDDTIAALKSKGVPVFWVGLPSIRGPKSTADAVYLNDLYRARAERAGITYIDVWDGFVDEGGKFTTFGPDFEGQNRRLRSGDGVYFTKYGARKVAHYVEREIRRSMSNRGPIALPSGPMGPVPSAGPAARPLAGPVVPLTVTPANSDTLLGGGPSGPAHGDALAQQVLVKGDALPAPRGRADNFVWPGAEQPIQPPPQPAPVAAKPAAVPPNAVVPEPVMIKPETPAAPAERKSEPKSNAKPATAPQTQPPATQRRADDTRPRPPQPVQQQPQQAPRQAQRPGPFDRGGPFGGLFR